MPTTKTHKLQIMHYRSGAVLYEGEGTIRQVLEAAVAGGAYLTDAYLTGAYLRGAYLTGAYLRGAYLTGAYLTGANLTDAYLTGANLRDANLGDAYLTGANLTGANLRGAYLGGADLTGANLTGANLRDANLTGANLRGAYLGGADLTGANLRGACLVGASVPTIPDIHRAVYAAASAPGALDMSAWHTCETTHCRAGWVVTLAGEPGRALEERVGPSVAAALIYQASDPTMTRVPDWLASDADALADMARLAGVEVSA